MENDEAYEMLGKENAFAVMNHKYDLDWLFGWIITQRKNMLGVS
jgi:hypothetical protein